MRLMIPAMIFAVVAALALSAQKPALAPLLHVRNSFAFTIDAPPAVVAPLFGAQRERAWAEGWDPQFLYPQPPEDKWGVVFTVTHGRHSSTWITTVFEPEKGHIQHVYFIPDTMVTLIDIHLAPSGASGTRVEVIYERTALSPELNDHVQEQGRADSRSADHWRAAIEDCLKKEGKLH
jgi:hypothetical protein